MANFFACKDGMKWRSEDAVSVKYKGATEETQLAECTWILHREAFRGHLLWRCSLPRIIHLCPRLPVQSGQACVVQISSKVFRHRFLFEATLRRWLWLVWLMSAYINCKLLLSCIWLLWWTESSFLFHPYTCQPKHNTSSAFTILALTIKSKVISKK